MTERITSITMQAFRGIAESFTLDLRDGRSCVILGDNGTGKSSIADAVEWYFTGQVELLTKEGRGSAIRHSGARDALDTKVTVSTDGSLSGTCTQSAPSRQNVRGAGRTELFLLRGRTLADFIDKTKGEKWQALSELLGLDEIEQMRRDLQRARNDLESQAKSAESELSRNATALRRWVSDGSDEGILKGIASLCDTADVQPPISLEEALSPQRREGVVPQGSQDQSAATLRAALEELRVAAEQPVSLDQIDIWNQFITEGQRDQLPLSLYRAAESLLASGEAQPGQCPLCRQPVNLDELGTALSGELRELEEAGRALETAKQAARQFVGDLRGAHSTRSGLVGRVSRQGIELAALPRSPRDELDRDVEAASRMERSPTKNTKVDTSVRSSKRYLVGSQRSTSSFTPKEESDRSRSRLLATRALSSRLSSTVARSSLRIGS